jgi:Flp pilus assembly protein TadB
MSRIVPALMGASVGLGAAVMFASTGRVDLRADVDALVVQGGRRDRSTLLESVTRRLVEGRSERRRQDLAVTDVDAMAYETRRVVLAVGGAGLVVLAALLLPFVGGHLPVGVLLVAVVVVVAGAVLVPEWDLSRTATKRRRDVVSALSAYLDLVTILLAGGAGLETAAQAAAEAGDGWTFRRIGDELARARATRQSLWTCIGDLGRRIGVEEFVELAAAMQAAGRHGSRISESLAVRAEATRQRLHHEIEAEANSASERMGLPTVLMFMGFLFLLGYPAVHIILGSA